MLITSATNEFDAVLPRKIWLVSVHGRFSAIMPRRRHGAPPLFIPRYNSRHSLQVSGDERPLNFLLPAYLTGAGGLLGCTTSCFAALPLHAHCPPGRRKGLPAWRSLFACVLCNPTSVAWCERAMIIDLMILLAPIILGYAI